MIKLTAKEICNAVGGKLYGNGEAVLTEISTDSRKVNENCLFIGIKGENFDGSLYGEKALSAGAAAALISCEITPPEGKAVIVADDTRAALLTLAGYVRDKFDIKLVGITGSVGKTTTKEMIYKVMSSGFNTHKTEGNFNNDIGLPLTLLKLSEQHSAAVIEMGMSAAGEISVLTRAAKPTAAVITNIGMSHIEHLKTRENILKAKLEILEGLAQDGVLIINGDDEYLSKVSGTGFRTVRYGFGENCDIKGEITSENTMLCMGEKITIPIEGKHNMYNALAAIAVGREYGISIHDAAQSIADFETDARRQNIVKVGDITVICDYYNANPQSMAAALELLCGGEAERRIAVLGDMLELGDFSKGCHAQIGEKAAQTGVDMVFAYGEMAEELVNAAKKAGILFAKAYADKKELAKELTATLKKGDKVLIKGSRGMKMEEVYEVILSEMDN
ncbi:MAG: UDP-N-acetylmuramoyl-tripeptide--D-alanyl-D-alanine ligase [Clostridia bacterium]|nr:UDP-N-acetylmuramoyl-tripeptide--D-alanyl-D-alanine ligase [Clostridia bacterium]